MNSGRVGDEEEKSGDLELYVYTLRHAVVDCSNDSRDRREEDGTQGDGALEGAESNGDYFGIFRWAAHEDRDGTREVFMIFRKEPQFIQYDATDVCLSQKAICNAHASALAPAS